MVRKQVFRTTAASSSWLYGWLSAMEVETPIEYVSSLSCFKLTLDESPLNTTCDLCPFPAKNAMINPITTAIKNTAIRAIIFFFYPF